MLWRLPVSGVLATIGLSIGIALPQLFPRQAVGEPVKTPYSAFHIAALAISVDLPWINASIARWSGRDRILAIMTAIVVIILLWFKFDWQLHLINSWEHAW